MNSADAWLANKDASRAQPAEEASREALEWVPENGSRESEDHEPRRSRAPEQPKGEAPTVSDRDEPGYDARELADLLRSEVEVLTRRIEELEAQLTAAKSDAERAKRWVR